MSPSQYFLIRNSSKIFSCLDFCSKELNEWFELTKNENKNITVHPFGEQTQNLFDTLTINHSDRE